MRCSLFGGIICLAVAGCSGNSPMEPQPAPRIESVKSLFKSVKGESESSAAVERTLQVEFHENKFEEAPLQEGTAVLLNKACAYWVKDGKVYALNSLAASYSPDAEFGPPYISKNSFLSLISQNDIDQVLENNEWVAGKTDNNDYKHRSYIGNEAKIFRRKSRPLTSSENDAKKVIGEQTVSSGNSREEVFYRDSKGSIISESEAEDQLRQIRSSINSMTDNSKRAYMEGVLQALEDEWARTKSRGPISK